MRSKLLLIAIAVAGLVVGIGGGLYLGLPILAQRFAIRAVERAASAFGQQAQWSQLVLHGYESVEIVDFGLRSPDATDDEPPLLHVKRIEVQIDPSSVFSGKVRLRQVVVEEPALHGVIRADGSTNFSAALAKLELLVRDRQDGGSAGDSSRSPFRYLARVVPTLDVRSARLTLQVDAPEHPLHRGSPWRLADATFHVEDQSPTTDNWDLRFSGVGQLPAFGAELGAEGRLRHPGRSLDLALSMQGPIQLPVGDRVLTIDGLAAGLRGALRIEGVALSAPNAPDTVAASARRVEVSWVDGGLPTGAPAGAAGLLAAVETVRVVQPVVRVQRFDDGRTNYDDLLQWARRRRSPRAAAAAAGATPDRSPEKRPNEPQPAGQAEKPKAVPPGDRTRVALERQFSRIERAIRTATDVASAIGDALPQPTIEIDNGTIRYVDDRWMEAGYQQQADHFALTAKRLPGEPVAEILVEFRTPHSDGAVSENSARLRVHLQTGDAQADFSAQFLPLSPYAPIVPSPFVTQPGTALHHTRVNAVWTARKKRLQVEGMARVQRVGVAAAAVAEQVMWFPDVGAKLSGEFDLEAHSFVFDPLTILLGGAEAELAGTVLSTTDSPKFEVQIRVPEQPFQTIFDGLAPELVPELAGLQIDGTLSWKAVTRADSADWDTFEIDAEDARLRGIHVQTMGKRVRFSGLRGPFVHTVEEPDGSMQEFMSGPGAQDYVLYRDISDWMTQVITTTEDGRFFRHRGFSPFSIRESIISNLTKARFARGASTVTQQLAKNLYLTRGKTVSRKLQEAIIAWQLEEHLTKNEILELYFNVIEFGPSIYGIHRAARHYFRKHPRDLDLLECLFLASLIPNPKKYYYQYKRGEVTPNWQTRLRFVGNAMVERGKITQEQFDALGDFSPRFWNSPPRPDDALAPILDNLDNPNAEGPFEDLPTLIDNEEQGEPGVLFDPGE